jgi:hypothetical protein
MPDMDASPPGSKKKSFSQIVILTVQDDMDYIRRAMLAGAPISGRPHDR